MTGRTSWRNGVLAGLLLLGAAGLSACGFRPLYGEHSTGVSAARELALIQLNTRNDRLDYLVRTQLIDKLQIGNEGGLPRYELVVRLRERREGVAIDRDQASTTRFNYQLTANFELFSLTNQQKLFAGQSRSVAAYNVVDNQFATLSARRDAEERTARGVADDIKIRLAIYFDRQMAGAGQAQAELRPAFTGTAMRP